MYISRFSKESKRHNLLHSILIMGALFGLLCLIGALFGGLQGMLYAAGLAILLALFGPNVSPQMVLRLFKAKPLDYADAPRIYDSFASLARRAALSQTPKIYHIPSKEMNAFSVGNNKEAVIAVTDGLLRTLNLRELLAVLSHELSHISNNDMRVMGLADIFSRLTNFFSTVGQMLLILNLPLLLMGMITIPWSALLLLVFAPLISNLLQLGLSRTREFDADIGAVELTGDPEGLIEALKKIEYQQSGGGGIFHKVLQPGKGIPNPSIFRTHPLTPDRIEKLRQLAIQKKDSFYFSDQRDHSIPEHLRPSRKPKRHPFSGLWY